MGTLVSTPEEHLLNLLKKRYRQEYINCYLNKNLNIDHVYPCGKTALFYSGYNEYITADIIYKMKPNLNIRDNNGDVAIRYVRCYDLFLEDPNFNAGNINNDGESILFHISLSKTLLRKFVRNGANIHQTNKDGKRLLHIKDIRTDIPALVSLGYDLEHEDNEGKTALISAVEHDDIEKIKALLKAGANPNHRDNNGDSALVYFNHRRGPHNYTVDILLLNGIRPESKNDFSALEKYYHSYGCRYLISHGGAHLIDKLSIKALYESINRLYLYLEIDVDIFKEYLKVISTDAGLDYFTDKKLDLALLKLEDNRLISRYCEN